MDLSYYATGLLDTAKEAGAYIFVALIIGAILLFAFRSGVFIKRPIKVYVKVKRAGGNTETVPAKGRYMPGGKFEIYYGLNDFQEIDAPPEEYVSEGAITFIREGRDSYYPTREKIDNKEIELKPSNSSAMKLSYASTLRDYYERFTSKAWWIQHADKLALILGFIIFALAYYFAMEHYTAAENAHTAAITALTHELKNFNIVQVVYNGTTNSTATISINPA